MTRLMITAGMSLLSLLPGSAQDFGWTAVKAAIRAAFPTVEHLSPEELRGFLATKGAAVRVIDVRTPEEMAVSHLAGAIRLDPDATEFPMLAGLPREAPVVVYCSVGYRSARVAHRMAELGFTAVKNLEGGIFDWANLGFPLVRDGRPTGMVHPYNQVWGALLHTDLRAPVDDFK